MQAWHLLGCRKFAGMNVTDPIQIQTQVSLQALNTFGLAAQCEAYAAVHDEVALQAFLQRPDVQAMPKSILGGGSNLLLVGDVQGLLLHNCMLGRRVVTEDETSVVVAAGGGEPWHAFVLWTLAQDWGGLENLSLIPGNVGASPIQNIGAYGVEIKDVFVGLRAMHLQSGSVRAFGADECAFGYRDSIFKRELRGQYMITEVQYRLQKAPHVLQTGYGAITDELAKLGQARYSIQDVSRAVIAIRQSKLPDPAQIGNAGSFFKNPEMPRAQFEALKAAHPTLPGYVVDAETMKVPAGWLIEQAGWKGKRIGNYGVHAQQALVLVNYGGASGADILALSSAIMADVAAKYGVALEREVNMLGEAPAR
jgi:UDP-N-acetylmuramate dehydrogenase